MIWIPIFLYLLYRLYKLSKVLRLPESEREDYWRKMDTPLEKGFKWFFITAAIFAAWYTLTGNL